MSIQRQMKRALWAANPTSRPEREQPTKLHGKRAYSVLHPSKGWRRYSTKRALAQQRMAMLLDPVRRWAR